jgi:FAD-linked sulfhydryl oxidase
MPNIDEWGRAGWVFMHSCAHAYPEDPNGADRRGMADFLRSIGAVLPCRACRRHYDAYMSRHFSASVLSNRTTLTQFLVEMHNDVNRRLGKASLRYDAACAVYEGDSPRRAQLLIAMAVLCILALGLLLHHFKKNIKRSKKA